MRSHAVRITSRPDFLCDVDPHCHREDACDVAQNHSRSSGLLIDAVRERQHGARGGARASGGKNNALRKDSRQVEGEGERESQRRLNEVFQ